jgi:uncharacterized membrane protein YbhN (UPF0104 family)
VRRLREHPVATTALAFGLAAVAVLAIAAAYGFGTFPDAWSNLQPAWLVLAIGAELLAIPLYVIAYRAVARIHGGPALSLPLAARVVAAGFGPFAVGGGFSIDKRALHAMENDREVATVRVLGLGALEWALLAPAAWVCAVVLLVTGNSRVMPSLLWPWAIAVPTGFAIGLWLAAPERPERFERNGGSLRRGFGQALRGVGILHSLARNLSTCWMAWPGTTLYWAADIASFYGAIRFIGLHPSLGETVLAYATGYALTRRSTPLGGAGTTEVLMTFSLHWVGQPVAPALAAVVVYRASNFVLPTVPALLARRSITPLLDATDEGAGPAARTRRPAARTRRRTSAA